jgi:hypothetical protein
MDESPAFFREPAAAACFGFFRQALSLKKVIWW